MNESTGGFPVTGNFTVTYQDYTRPYPAPWPLNFPLLDGTAYFNVFDISLLVAWLEGGAAAALENTGATYNVGGVDYGPF